MHISSNNWTLSLDMNGGRISELSHSGIKVFGTYNRMDGKQGNTHLCVPCFDKEGQEMYNLPFHGLVRGSVWKEERREKNEVEISIITPSTDLYPAQLKVVQTFRLDDDFTHTISIINLDGRAVPVNCGVHYYWDTPSGWNEIKIQNQNSNQNIKEKIENNGYINLDEKNTIIFPHASYKLISNGFGTAVLWTSFKTTEKGEKQYSQDFCCIEPVIAWPGYFGSERSKLLPKAGVSASISIKKVV